MARFSIKAVLLGALVETACAYGYSFASSFTLAVALTVRGASEERIRAGLVSLPFLVGAFVAGTASALLGGFVAARIAKARELLHAVLSALPCMVLGVVLLSKGAFKLPPNWYVIAAFSAVIPAALTGGYLGLLRNQTLAASRAARAPAPAPPVQDAR